MKIRTNYWDLSNIVQVLCVLYISVWAISPPLSYGTGYRVLAVVATMIWLFIEFWQRPRSLLKPSLPVILIGLYILYTALISLWVDGVADVVRNLQIYICLLFALFYESYKRRNDLRRLRVVFWVSLILTPIWLVTTYRTYEYDPHISRLLTRSTGIEQQFMEQGIGGYGLVYSVLLGIPILLYIGQFYFANRRYLLIKAPEILLYGLVVVNAVLGCAVILKAGYSIAVILLTGGVAITLLVRSKSTNTVLFLAFVFIIALTFSTEILSGVLEGLATVTEGSLYERKVNDVMETLTMKQNVGTVSLRTERYWRSVFAVWDNPLLGGLKFDLSGKHSAILDGYSRYGLVVGTIFLYLLSYLQIQYMRRVPKKAFGMALAVCFISVSFSFLNNIFSSFGFMIYIFYPVAFTYIADANMLIWKLRRPKVQVKALASIQEISTEKLEKGCGGTV